MSDEAFGRTTYRRLYRQLARWEQVQRRADLRAGLLASLLYNPNRKKGSKALGSEDFFPER